MIQNDEQRSLDWYRSRLGHITGSKVSVLIGSGRKEAFTQTGIDYIYQLAAERMLNPDIVGNDINFEGYLDTVNVTTKAMQYGIDHEDEAKALFMQSRFPEKELLEVGSCLHPTIEKFAASPDGLIRDFDGDGNMAVIEVKCPAIKTYVLYSANINSTEDLLKVKPEYYWQMQAEMVCTGCDKGFFVCYSPFLLNPLHVVEINRVGTSVANMENRVKLANEYIEKIVRNELGC